MSVAETRVAQKRLVEMYPIVEVLEVAEEEEMTIVMEMVMVVEEAEEEEVKEGEGIKAMQEILEAVTCDDMFETQGIYICI